MRLRTFISSILFSFVLLIPFQIYAEEKVDYKCTITITTENIPENFAYPTGKCKNFFEGYYIDGTFAMLGSYSGTTYNGHKIYVHLPIDVGDGYPNVELTVITKSVGNKQDNSNSTGKNTNSGSKPSTSKPTTTNKNDIGKTTNQNKSNTGNKTTTTNTQNKNSNQNKSPQTKTTTEKSNLNTKTQTQQSKQSKNTESTQTKTADKKEQTKAVAKINDPTKEFTVEEMKKANAKVVFENGKYFAVMGDLKKEITEEQAKELGYPVENSKQEMVSTADEDKTTGKEKENKENSSNVVVIAFVSVVVLCVVIGVIYYFMHKKTK